jgi:hypothetical protein
VLPHRKFIYEDEFMQMILSTPTKGTLKKIAKKDVKRLRLFLFNDMLLVAKPQKVYFEPKFQMMLDTTMLVAYDVRGKKSCFSMKN